MYIMFRTDECWGAVFLQIKLLCQSSYFCLEKIKFYLTAFVSQNDGLEGEKDDDVKKSKRRPRPDPLFIPPPKLIAPPVYSSITSYQSHLRSPVRLTDNPVTMPPYTPPPILSPVREGSGLYFSTFLSSVAASGAGLPPPATPKSATRSLLRSSESNKKRCLQLGVIFTSLHRCLCCL